MAPEGLSAAIWSRTFAGKAAGILVGADHLDAGILILNRVEEAVFTRLGAGGARLRVEAVDSGSLRPRPMRWER